MAMRATALVLVALLISACGSANVNALRRYHGRQLPAPRGLVVFDFEPTAESIGLGTGREGVEDKGGLSKDEMRNRREVGRVLADVLARELENRGIPTSRKSGPLGVPEGSMSIGGQILTIDEGSGAKRIFIGFGSGRSQFSSVAQLFGNTPAGPANLFEFQNTAKSGAKPGILTTLPIGIAVQGVTLVLLVVQGGMAGMGELSSTSTANAKRMAKELADAVETALKRVSTPR
jgi:hypothetical protein